MKAGAAWGALGLVAAMLAACGDAEQSAGPGAAGSAGLDAGTDVAALDAADALPDVAPTPCDFRTQDCASAAAKCSIVQQGAYAPVCVPLQGDRGTGESCERTALGYDDCAAGNLCSPAAQSAGDPMACRTLCDANAQCDAPERCYRFSRAQSEIYGMCVPACVFFETDCGTGRHCLLVADADGSPFPICDDHGDVAEGEPCASAGDCGEGMACAGVNMVRTCRAYCDPANPCATALRTCTPLGAPELPGLGVCVPA